MARRGKRKVKVQGAYHAAASIPLALPSVGFARLPAVLAVVGIGKSTLWNMVRDGAFPAPVRLSTRSVGWSVADIHSWIEARIAAAQRPAA